MWWWWEHATQTLREWAAKTGGRARIASFADAAAHGEIVLNATAGHGSLDALRMEGATALKDKGLIDIANPWTFPKDSHPACFFPTRCPSVNRSNPRSPTHRSGQNSEHSGAMVMVDPGKVGGGDHDLSVCGNDPAAKNESRGTSSAALHRDAQRVNRAEGKRVLQMSSAGNRPIKDDLKRLLGDTAQRAARSLLKVSTSARWRFPNAIRGPEPFRRAALAESPTDPGEVIHLLDSIGSPATMAMAGPRFFGFVIGGSLPASLAANWLAGAWDQTAHISARPPATATLEQVALRWLLELFGLPRNPAGAFVTGATLANFSALAAARHAVLSRVGWNVEADGLIGAPPITLTIGEEAHPTVFKSLGLLGLGRNPGSWSAPVDSQGRMRAEAFPRVSRPHHRLHTGGAT